MYEYVVWTVIVLFWLFVLAIGLGFILERIGRFKEVKRNDAAERGICPHCGYDTRHIESDVCPECGRRAPLAWKRKAQKMKVSEESDYADEQ